MKVKELIQTLMKLDGDLEVYFEYNYLDCGGHESGEYCYCSYIDVRKNISSVDLAKIDTKAKKLKTAQIVLRSND